MTPYYSETVTYSMKQLVKPNEDGISDLYYLQKIYPGQSPRQADSRQPGMGLHFTAWSQVWQGRALHLRGLH